MANQIIIDIGAVANDGTGDPLRTAFGYVNNNFSNVWASGVANSNIQFDGNRILTTNVNGNLVLAPNGIGKVQANVDIVPNANNTLSLGSLTRQWNTVYAQNLEVGGNVTFNNLTVNGNLTVDGDIIQIGNLVTDAKTIQLANTAGTDAAANGSGITVGASDDVATLLYNSTNNVWTTNIGISSVGNITAPYFFGNGSQLTGIVSSYGNSNVSTLLAAFGSNTIVTTGNITGGNLLAPGAVIATLLTGGNLQVTGGVSGSTVTAVANVTGGNILTTGIVTAAGNVTGNYFIGNGSQLTGLSTSSISNGTSNVLIATANGNVTVTASGTEIWTFGTDGNLNYPDGTISTGGAVYAAANSSVAMISNNEHNQVRVEDDYVEIFTSPNGIVLKTWQFGNTGVLTLPNGAWVKDTIDYAVAIGAQAGANTQGEYAVAIGYRAGEISQGDNAVAIGIYAGNATQGTDAVAIGTRAGDNNQGISSVAIGSRAGQTTQGDYAVAMGENAGRISQTDYAVAIGTNAGYQNQGIDAVAIGTNAGYQNQGNNSIILNATGSNLNQTTANTFTVAPVRNDVANIGQVMFYNTTSKEITYGNTVSVAGNITGNYILGNGSQLTGLSTSSISNGTSNVSIASANGNATITANTVTYTFGTNSTLTLPGGSQISPLGANLDIIAGTGSYVNLITSDESSSMGVDNGGGYIVTAGGTWDFDTTGNLTAPGNISAVGNITGGNVTVTGNITGNTAGFAIGYRDIPQVSFVANATISTTDAGKHYYSTESTDYILTIANNASQGFAVGAAITIVNQGTGNITVAQGSGVTLYLSGNATSGNRNVTTFGMATVMKVATDTWFINGTGVV